MKIFFFTILFIFSLHCVAETNVPSTKIYSIRSIKQYMDKDKDLIISLFIVLLCVKTLLLIVVIKQRIKIKKIKKAFLNNNLNPDFINKDLDNYLFTELKNRSKKIQLEESEMLKHISGAK